MPDAADCYILRDCGEVFVAGFVQPEMFDVFQKSSGQKMLREWIRTSGWDDLVGRG